ncbi:MAG: bifunctional methionine sulfoxide reductase B/A protein [Candidatus Riflebacteria bacterium]|nr:bifunctional methionine sulfoxide reductase B/A protein [Candidatus Riflebacteria bacterium]
MSQTDLTPEEERVIVHRGTELPFTGKFVNHKEKGTYTCRRCGASLYKSESKFESGCGWPSFDDEIPGAVTRKPDPDGHRVEIVCSSCDAHLGHVFVGEGFTAKNQRHCVNSISMSFIPATDEKTSSAIFAAGCFWGVEHLMKQVSGVKSTTVGYTGGETQKPDYKAVCTGTTGHLEAVKIDFDPAVTSFEALTKLFFEIHDFTQTDGQGPDIGTQYLSAIFYADESQKKQAEDVVKQLESMGHKVATRLIPASAFWPAEDYHQDYYSKTGKAPYCHIRRRIF